MSRPANRPLVNDYLAGARTYLRRADALVDSSCAAWVVPPETLAGSIGTRVSITAIGHIGGELPEPRLFELLHDALRALFGGLGVGVQP